MLSIIMLALIVFAIIAVEAFFSGAEAAMLSCDKVAVAHLANLRNRRARRLHKMLSKPDKIVATTLLGTNLCVVSNSMLLTVFASEHLGIAAPAAVTLILGPLVFFFGELLPKIYSQQKANRLALAISGPLRFTQIVMSPVTLILNLLQRRLTGKLGENGRASEAVLITRDQLACDSQVGLSSLRRIGPRALSRVIQFSEKRVEDIMVDVSQVFSVSPDMTTTRAMNMTLDRGLSRLLVHSGRISNLIGFVHVSSLHAAAAGSTVESVMSELLYVAEAERGSSVLKKMQSLHIQMAAVVNEFGACVGIVTLEDLIEEVFGEIRDEFDRSPRIETHPEQGLADVDAYIGISELRSMLDITLPSGRYETLAGFLIERYGAIPPIGTSIPFGNRRFIIFEADERSVKRVRIIDDTSGKKRISERIKTSSGKNAG
ncbi:HlyC/CorC family transporter [bacterium]|nr:HlyC/CorC family transporter [bacterium]